MKVSTDSTAAKSKEKKQKKTGSAFGWLDRMKKLDETHPKLAFLGRAAGFYFLMLVLYLYFMLANLSTAPKFVYTQF